MKVTPEQIEALQCNLATLRGLDGGLRMAMEDIPKKDFIFLLSDGTCDAANPKQGFEYEIYRLRPDYKPESEIVECEIMGKPHHKGRCYANHTDEDSRKMWISEATHQIDFIGFKFDCGYAGNSSVMYLTGERESEVSAYEHLVNGTSKPIHATHVLFRKQ